MPGHVVELDVDGDFAVTWFDRSGRPFIEVFPPELAVAESFFQFGEDVSFKLCGHGSSSLGVIVSELALRVEEGQEREQEGWELGRVGMKGRALAGICRQVRKKRRRPKLPAPLLVAWSGRSRRKAREVRRRYCARAPDLRLAGRLGGASASGAQPRRCGRKIEARRAEVGQATVSRAGQCNWGLRTDSFRWECLMGVRRGDFRIDGGRD